MKRAQVVALERWRAAKYDLQKCAEEDKSEAQAYANLCRALYRIARRNEQRRRRRREQQGA